MRIAHITDFHARDQLPGSATSNDRWSRDMFTLIPKALKMMQSMSIDFLAVTGDLLDAPLHMLGDIPEYEKDKPDYYIHAAREDYKTLKSILDESGIPYMVLPGNHDHEPTMWEVFPFKEHETVIKGHRMVRFTDREFFQSQARRFDPHRQRFENTLADTTLPQVHLQHYVITPPIEHWYPHNYADADNLLKMTASASHVRLSLCGHYHPGCETVKHGQTLFSVAPAFSHFPHVFRVYDLSGDTVHVEEHRLMTQKPADRRAIVLDRDGVITTHGRYRYGVEALELIPGSAEAIRKLNHAGWAVMTLSNQVGIGRGYFPLPVVEAVNDKLFRLLRDQGACIDAAYLAMGAGELAATPMFADESRVKPSPYFVELASKERFFDFSEGMFVGDRMSDIECGLNAGMKTTLVRTGLGNDYEARVRQEFPNTTIHDNLADAVDAFLKN